ncbi:MAG: hypothetical protein ACYDCC_08960 [Actinomycetota bacterium]
MTLLAWLVLPIQYVAANKEHLIRDARLVAAAFIGAIGFGNYVLLAPTWLQKVLALNDEKKMHLIIRSRRR